MKRRPILPWEPQHKASVRHRVAVEAARILYHREVKEYFHAKREAAKRQHTHLLPSNREVHDQLLLIARKLEGDEHALRLDGMRRSALRLMEVLEDFQPRLIGSVLTGHIRQGSDIDLNAHSHDLETVCQTLTEAGYQPEVEVVRARKDQEYREFTHVRLSLGAVQAEITIYPPDYLHTAPRCGITGKSQRRASTAEVRQLLLGPPTAAAAAAAKESWPLEPERWLELLPELRACQGVVQNHFHHLDVLDHTLAVVRGLETMLGAGCARFGRWQKRLATLFAEPGQALLLSLSGLFHDLGKPATQSFSRNRDGELRIRFLGHEQVGARLVDDIGARLGMAAEQIRDLRTLVALHLDAVLVSSHESAPSSIYRLLLQAGSLAPHLALLSLADVEAALGPAQTEARLDEHREFVDFLLEQYFEQGFLAQPTPPVSEEDLLEQFGPLPDKLRRRLLDRLTCAYVDGEYDGLEQGLELASDLLAYPDRTD